MAFSYEKKKTKHPFHFAIRAIRFVIFLDVLFFFFFIKIFYTKEDYYKTNIMPDDVVLLKSNKIVLYDMHVPFNHFI